MEGTQKSHQTTKRPPPSSLRSSPFPPAPLMKEIDVDDKEVEKFYALIRSLRTIRDQGCKRLKKNGSSGEWKPVFKMEDFAPAGDLRSSSENSTSSKEILQTEIANGEDGGTDANGGVESLDLNISL